MLGHTPTVYVLRANGLEIAFERIGDGPPLLLVHGAGDDHRIWRPQLDALAGELTVVAWDEPGAGRSSDLPPGFGIADFAQCLAALIEAQALGAVHLAGLSWGGTVALELYRHRPELVATLILADTYAGWKGSLPEDEVRARVEAGERVLVDLAFPGMFAGEPPRRFVPLLRELASAVRPESVRAQLRIMAETDQRDLLPRVAVPTLLIWGELDARSPLGVAHEFARTIPNARLVVIPAAGHLSNLDQPERFSDAVRTFCSSHSA